MKLKRLVDNEFWQEMMILLFCFILFTINDWIFILTWRGLFTGSIYFFILYGHAQFNRYFLLPFLLKKNRPWLYFSLTILALLVFSGILYEVSTQILYRNCFLYNASYQKTYSFQLGTLAGTLVCILGSVQILEHYREQKKKNREQLLFNEVQLNALKGQLNPHFLFNTFNTLYGISLQYPERTSDMIMKVSQLMRYQIETNAKDYVPLEDEIDFLNSYIGLEKERVGYRCTIHFDYPSAIDRKLKIAPMLLITFVDNAFKHGACTIENCYVNIAMEVTENRLFLEVVNSVPKKRKAVHSTKIGLNEAKERLDILYPEKHKLDINETEDTFTVKLEIELC